MSGDRVMQALIAGELTMCQARGCANLFPPATGRGAKRYCDDPRCPRRRKIRAQHRRQALKDVKAELEALEHAKPIETIQAAIHELSAALKADDATDEDLRIAACKLAAAGANVAATVEALGRGGLSSLNPPRPERSSTGPPPARRSLPTRTGPQQDAARAMLEAAS